MLPRAWILESTLHACWKLFPSLVRRHFSCILKNQATWLTGCSKQESEVAIWGLGKGISGEREGPGQRQRSSKQQIASKNKVGRGGSSSSVLMKKSQGVFISFKVTLLCQGQSTSQKQPKEASFIVAPGFRGICIHPGREGMVELMATEPCVGRSSSITDQQAKCPGWNQRQV